MYGSEKFNTQIQEPTWSGYAVADKWLLLMGVGGIGQVSRTGGNHRPLLW